MNTQPLLVKFRETLSESKVLIQLRPLICDLKLLTLIKNMEALECHFLC